MPHFSLRSLCVVVASCYLVACATKTEKKLDSFPIQSVPIQSVPAQAVYDKSRDLQNFDDYVLFLKGKALTEGVSQQTLQQHQNIQFVQSAVDLDRKQSGNKAKQPVQIPVSAPKPQIQGQAQTTPVIPKVSIKSSTKAKKSIKNSAKKSRIPSGKYHATTRYLNRVLTDKKVAIAQQLYQQHQTLLQPIATNFGVPAEYIVALWGMESSFGRYQGKYDVLSVLATLAFEGRREKLFSREFISALKMLDQKTISREKMKGSWAGAMGQTQFMPTSYFLYGADGNQDKEKDIWQSYPDVFASIANYLSTVGWDANLPWGVEVVANKHLVHKLAGIDLGKKRSLKQWKKLGVKFKFAKSVSPAKRNALLNANLWLVSPDGAKGRVFLVTNNYRTLLNWNRSNHFALSIGMFAERIKGF